MLNSIGLFFEITNCIFELIAFLCRLINLSFDPIISFSFYNEINNKIMNTFIS